MLLRRGTSNYANLIKIYMTTEEYIPINNTKKTLLLPHVFFNCGLESWFFGKTNVLGRYVSSMYRVYVGAIQNCVLRIKSAFVGVMNEQFNLFKMHRINNVKTLNDILCTVMHYMYWMLYYRQSYCVTKFCCFLKWTSCTTVHQVGG